MVIDIFLKEAQLYDKLLNNFDIFFQETFYTHMFFQKTQNKKSSLEMNKMVIYLVYI